MMFIPKLLAGLVIVTELLPLVSATLSAGPNRNAKSNSALDKQIIIVSTVDGKLSALNLRKSGELLWTIDLNDGPLISSSITNLVYEEKGKTVRLIPSLHGGLFKFDGDTVEAVPFNADTLLQSSFRLAENTVLVGGKETHFTGIDIQSGKILYSCNVKGCDQQQTVPDTSDIIVVKRFQQTVRSIESRNGAENWNFSVGEVELQYVKGSETRLLQNSGEKPSPNPDGFNFDHNEKFEDYFDMSDLSRIKFVVPDGTVCIVKSSNKQTVMWKHTFSSAISSAWVLFNNRLQKLDMFDASKVPALGKEDNSASSSDVIYMGTYNKQVYVQASPSVQNAVSQAVINTNVHSPRHPTFTAPRFTHKHCSSKSNFLTISGPDAISKDGKETALVAVEDGKLATKLDKHIMLCPDSTQRKGYYFQGDLSYYSRIQQSGRKGRNTISSENNGSHFQNSLGFLETLSFYFREIFLTLLALISIPFLLLYFPAWFSKKRLQSDSNSSEQYQTANGEILTFSLAREYESRFLQDFEPQECLGKGGFGVVFKARNKMDGCSYAVKRILLPQNKSAREKVLREVRALAQLDHPYIVRYFNAWSEQPPEGWQKQQDDKLASDFTSWSSMPRESEMNKNSPSTSNNSSQTSAKQPSESCADGFEVVVDESKGFFAPGYSQGFSLHPNELAGNQQLCLGNDQHSQSSASWAETSTQHNVPETIRGKFFQSHSSDSGSSDDSSLADDGNSLPFKNYRNADESMSILFGDHTENNNKEVSTKTSNETQQHTFHSSELPGTRDSPSDKPDVCIKVESSQKGKVDRQLSNDTVYLYIQMQLCQKQSLKEWLITHVHREKKIYTKIFLQVTEAVKYVHDCGLIHRDLKPSNVLFSPDGTIKVGDFGLVTHAGDLSTPHATAFDNENNRQHTRQAGTTLYMAPEQMTSRSYTEKVDIFSLGLIFYELVFPFDTQMEKVRHFSDARHLKFSKHFRSKFPQEAALIYSMLQKDAASRPSAQEIQDDKMFGT